MKTFDVYKYDNTIGFESRVWLGTINAETMNDALNTLERDIIPQYFNKPSTVYDVKER